MEDAEFAVIQLAQTTMRSELGKKTVCSEYAVWVEVGEGPFVPEPGAKAGQGIHLWLLSSCCRQNQIGFCVPGENEPECYDCRSVSSLINSNTYFPPD